MEDNNSSKIAKAIVVILLLAGLGYGAYYIYQNTKADPALVASQTPQVIVVSADILDNKNIDKVNQYVVNGALPITVDNAGKPNPFSPMQ
jgi:uncharacterized membrane protein YebE (DUF533 family)